MTRGVRGVLLAAGAARRFGAPKLLQELGGSTVVRRSAEALRDLGTLLVVVPPEHDGIRRALAGLDVRFVVNPDPDAGIGSSVACAISALESDVTAAVIALADEPTPDPRALPSVLRRFRDGGVSIVVPVYRGARGHPVLFAPPVFDELRALSGDQGARAVTERDPGRIAFVELDAVKPTDVDTPDDLARLRSSVVAGKSLLDQLLPEYDTTASYGVDVAAPPEVVYRAVLETNLGDSRITRVLMVLRSLGRTAKGSSRLADLPDHGSFFRLAEDAPREIVIGVVGRFWALTGNLCHGDRESFRGPPIPGTAKAAWNFRVEPAPGGSRLTTETRVLCADDDGRRSFRRYWSVIGPFSGLIRMEALRLIRRQAQLITSPVSRLP